MIKRKTLIIVIRVLLNLDLAQQIVALLIHLRILAAVGHTVIVIHLVVVDVVEGRRIWISKMCGSFLVSVWYVERDTMTYLVVIFVSMLCVITTAFSSSLSIKLLFPVLVGSSFERSLSCSWITLFAVTISWLMIFEQNWVVTKSWKFWLSKTVMSI